MFVTGLNLVGFYAGWFACVVGAAHGWLALGPLVVAALVALHVVLSPHPRREVYLVLAAGLLGWSIDTLSASLGIYSFGDKSFAPWLCPPWMVALWMIFATTLNNSLAWLAPRRALAALLGGAAGPLSYYYGAKLGAIELSAPAGLSLVALAVVWAAALPGLFRLAQWINTRYPETAQAPG